MIKTHDLPAIRHIRRLRVVLDTDLAKLYGVTTKVFNQTIQRNIERFPSDFLFQLTREEVANLRSQIVTSSLARNTISKDDESIAKMHGGRRYQPFVFTEHGAIMAATLLRSPRAVAMSVYVVRAFVQMRDALLTNAAILQRLEKLDRKMLEHDVVLREVVEKLRPLLAPPIDPPKREIGFHVHLRKRKAGVRKRTPAGE